MCVLKTSNHQMSKYRIGDLFAGRPIGFSVCPLRAWDRSCRDGATHRDTLDTCTGYEIQVEGNPSIVRTNGRHSIIELFASPKLEHLQAVGAMIRVYYCS